LPGINPLLPCCPATCLPACLPADDISEDDLRDQFYAYGELRSVKKVASRGCAFVTYATREAAERGAAELANKLVVKGTRLKLLWGKPQAAAAPRPAGGQGGGGAAAAAAGGASGSGFPSYMPVAGSGAGGHYPSMDPSAQGSYQRQQQQQGGGGGMRPPGGPPPPRR
jgi:pre-mRNA-splicing factor RBM22/SLT11